MSDTKLIVTKDKLDKLATSISTKSGIATPMTIAQMKAAVDGISTSGITPTGTINITTNGTHDVTQYASAEVDVPSPDFIITLSYNDTTERWEPDCTWAELSAAYSDGKNLVLESPDAYTLAQGEWSSMVNQYYYTVNELKWSNDHTQFWIQTGSYIFDSTGIRGYGDNVIYYDTSDADAFAEHVISGKVFYTSTGREVGTAVSRASSDLIVSGATVTAPVGFYESAASASIVSGSATTPATTITANPTISVGSDGKITATTSASQDVTPTVSAGYVSAGTAGTITVSGSNTSQLTTQAAKTVTPTESEQTAVAANVYTTGVVKVGAISSTYVGSDIAQNDSDDLTVNEATITTPAGYYSEAASKSVASGTAGTPTATKGTVSNHSISITPSVTNTTGYITGGTKNGTAVSVSASELVSGTKTITANGTSDVTNYASVDVDVEPNLQAKTDITPTESSQTIAADNTYDGLSSVQINAISSTYVGSGVTRLTGSDLYGQYDSAVGYYYMNTPAGYYENGAGKLVPNADILSHVAEKGTVSNNSITITPKIVISPAGYITNGTKTGTVTTVTASELVSGTVSVTGSGTINVTNYAYASVPAGSATTPDTAITANPSISVNASGLITATASASQNVTPTISAGYVSSGTSGTITVSGSNTQQLTTKAAATYYPSTTDQTISASQYLTGAQTIKAVTVSGLSAANIASGVTVNIGDSADADRIMSVTGTLAFSTITVSSSDPSGGSDGDVWIKTS